MGRGLIAVHAQCVDVSREHFAAHREDGLLTDHPDDSFGGDGGVGDDGARDLARRRLPSSSYSLSTNASLATRKPSSSPARSISDPESAT